jgi:hypothetical protein
LAATKVGGQAKPSTNKFHPNTGDLNETLATKGQGRDDETIVVKVMEAANQKLIGAEERSASRRRKS